MTLQIIWFVLVVVLLAGYSILDGFDLGIGMLTPFVTRSETEKRVLFNAVGPFWDGNEVWLVTGGGALFAAFPPVYATVFSGFYLPLMLVLFALIFRAVALEFRSLEPERRRLWEWAFALGSAVPSLLYGVALGNLLQGIPLDLRGDYIGGFFTLLRPFPLLLGILSVLAFLMQGSAYGALRATGELRSRLIRVHRTTRYFLIVLLAVAVVVGAFLVPGAVYRFLPWLFVALTIAAWAAGRVALKHDRDGAGFLFSSMVVAGMWGIMAASQFPLLVRASNVPTRGLGISGASSSQLTLRVMLIIAGVGMPIVIAYTIWVYRMFRGRISPESLEDRGE